jgi:hypothetical protein
MPSDWMEQARPFVDHVSIWFPIRRRVTAS